MPYSYGDYKNEVIHHITEHTSEYSKILDVGPGAGTYGSMLRNLDIEALEIHPPYIEMFKLEEIYKKVHIGDIRNFDIEPFDYIIMGDVLEHLTIEESKSFLAKVANKKVMVAVPYLFEQGEEMGNIYETHHQPELTHELMIERYGLNPLYYNERYGYYTNY
jgi:predicted TPR repeat methyltransferase